MKDEREPTPFGAPLDITRPQTMALGVVVRPEIIDGKVVPEVRRIERDYAPSAVTLMAGSAVLVVEASKADEIMLFAAKAYLAGAWGGSG